MPLLIVPVWRFSKSKHLFTKHRQHLVLREHVSEITGPGWVLRLKARQLFELYLEALVWVYNNKTRRNAGEHGVGFVPRDRPCVRTLAFGVINPQCAPLVQGQVSAPRRVVLEAGSLDLI